MPTDTIMKELHRYRDEYAARFDYDLDAIYRDLKAKEQANPRPATPPPPEPTAPAQELQGSVPGQR